MTLVACGSKDGQDPDPLVEDFGYCLCAAPADLRDDKRRTCTSPGFAGKQRGLHPAVTCITGSWPLPVRQNAILPAYFTRGMGDVKDVEVSYDGSLLLFAMRAPDIPGADPEDQPTWNIWEYEITSGQLRRVAIGSDHGRGRSGCGTSLPA